MPKPPLHIFRAGRQTTAAGDEIEFSAADLQACADAYDPALHRAPIVVGHPKTDAPAYGVIKSLKVQGRDLVAEPDAVEPQFAELVKARRFIAVSAAFYRPTDARNPTPGSWYLRHVGFLGAEPPALKGLRSPEAAFAAGDEDFVAFKEVAFSDPAITSLADLFANLREWVIGKFGADEADKVVPRWQVDSIRSMGDERPYPMQEPAEREETVFNEGADGAANPQEAHVANPEVEKLQADLAAAHEAAAAAKKRADDLEAGNRAAALQARETAAAEFAEGLVAADKLLPKHKPLVVAVLTALDGEKPVEFGEGAERKPVATALRELLAELPKHALNGQHVATKTDAETGPTDSEAMFSEGQQVDPNSLALHRKAEALAKEKGLSYIDAVRQISGR